ncbi:peptidase M20 [Gammaproteobacteria bacterium]|nr:peptidase M20 [Gammaproteobacteria bacterium]
MLNLELYLCELEEIVNIDSGSYDANGVNKVQDWFYHKFVDTLGFIPTSYDFTPRGALKLGRSMLYATSANHQFDLLVLCHVDTVFPKGEVAVRPFEIVGDEVKGPGTADMKGGCLYTWYAIEELIRNKEQIGNIGFFFNGEHEIGCPNTRSVMEKLITESRIIIAGECTRANGAYVKQRKGILRFTLEFEGIEAHAGNNPQDGACALEEMAHWILALKGLANADKGITINTGIAKGGNSVNTIPNFAQLYIDIRVQEINDALEMEKKVHALMPFNSKVTVKITGGITRPPMVPNAKTEILCHEVEKIGEKHGVNVTWASVGGGSDASFASALGRPVLCGLTPTGTGAHTKNEAIFLKDIHQRYDIYRDLIKAFSNMTDLDLNPQAQIHEAASID